MQIALSQRTRKNPLFAEQSKRHKLHCGANGCKFSVYFAINKGKRVKIYTE